MTQNLGQQIVNRGHFMTTFTGKRFWPMDPRVEDMCVEDVAHHLAMQCRFNGATRDFYSVAEHCVIGSYLIDQSLAFEFLMHDRSETWLGDLIRPLKHGTLLGREYGAVESLVEEVSARKWGLSTTPSPQVKEIDNIMCGLEIRQLLHADAEDGTNSVCYPDSTKVKLSFWNWRRAESQFLERFDDLSKLRKLRQVTA